MDSTRRNDHPFVVLMADDDEDDCLFVELAFQEMGIAHDLHFVDDGPELLDYLYDEGGFSDREGHPRPDLILLDLNMPLMDGREALKRIKSDPALKDIPVLVLTTSRDKDDINVTRLAGASSFLPKPEVFEDLIEKLSRFCHAVIHNPNVPFIVMEN